jgi:hypothetical protein
MFFIGCGLLDGYRITRVSKLSQILADVPS